MAAVGAPSSPTGARDDVLALVDRRHVEREVAERMLQQHCPALSAGLVLRTVLICARELRSARVVHGLEPALEAMARYRLQRLAAADQ